MSIYIGNDLEDRLKILKTENVSLKKSSDYHQVVHEIDHMSALHVDSSFYRQSMKINNYLKIVEWMDYSTNQLTVIQELDKKGLHYPTPTKHKIEEDMLILKMALILFVI